MTTECLLSSQPKKYIYMLTIAMLSKSISSFALPEPQSVNN